MFDIDLKYARLGRALCKARQGIMYRSIENKKLNWH